MRELLSKLCSLIREVTSEDGTKISHTKLFSSVGYITGTWAIVYTTLHNNLNTECFLGYLTIVAAHATASKFIASKGAADDK